MIVRIISKIPFYHMFMFHFLCLRVAIRVAESCSYRVNIHKPKPDTNNKRVNIR